jgi:hypothetical protein
VRHFCFEPELSVSGVPFGMSRTRSEELTPEGGALVAPNVLVREDPDGEEEDEDEEEDDDAGGDDGEEDEGYSE